MPDPETVVRSFFAAWPRRNMEEVLGYFTDDALYHNMPLEPVTGKDGIREILNMFLFSDQRVFPVFRDSEHLPDPILRLETLAYGIFVWPEALRHSLVDYGYAR